MLGMVIANDLIRLSQAHATRHFLLRDDENNTTPLHLWLFLETLQVALSLPTSFIVCGLKEADKTLTSVSMPACKVMYREGSVTDGQQTSHPAAWAQPDLVENIQYPKEVCLQIRQFLHGSTLCYPPSRRHFTADWTVGFLQTASSISVV
jgi:hypothetical protein